MRRLFVPVMLIACACSAYAFPTSQNRPILPDNRDYSGTLKVLMQLPNESIDLEWSKLVIDNLVDPDADIASTVSAIDAISNSALKKAGPNPSDEKKLNALRDVIYASGAWNNDEPLSYDFENPNGRLAKNKTIAEYLHTRRGNCINMPALFMLAGQRMGLQLNITTAPRHVFVQYEDRTSGKLVHLEPTSGALPQRIVWQRQVLPMTDKAIETGMYMKQLSKHQQIAVFAETLLQALLEQDDPEERLQVAELMLSVFPQSDVALLHTYTAHQAIIERDFQSKYPDPRDIPLKEYQLFGAHAQSRDAALQKVHDLGWQRAVSTPQTYIPN